MALGHFVYFIQEVKQSRKAPVKIGFSETPERRLAEFQTGNPRELVIVQKLGPMSLSQARQMEQAFHRKFKRLRLRGEWFSGKVLGRLHELGEDSRAHYSALKEDRRARKEDRGSGWARRR